MRIRTTLMRSLAMAALAAAAFAAQATPATSYYVYDEAGHVIGEYDANGNPVQEHIYLGDRPVAVVQNGNASTLDYVTTDQLNTPRAVTDSSQTVVWSWSSDPFGNGQPTGSLTYNLRFPGQYYDAETGHNYNYYRDYDPGIGRYIESDPIGLYGGNMSTYSYVNGEPLTYIDPEGLAGIDSTRRKVRDCNSDEWIQCEAQCAGKGIRSCKRQQLLQPVRTINRNGTVITKWIWKDQSLSCDCKDPDSCKNALQAAAAFFGLSLTTYIIISEGSRLFPPRNLVPIP